MERAGAGDRSPGGPGGPPRGRGLTLAPAFFWYRAPVALLPGTEPPTLVYAVARERGWDAEPETRPSICESLVALLGRTRARVLCAIADHPHVNTTELARAVGISAAGASQHASVLRDAGLVTTFRKQGSALHRISERGAVLLDKVPSVHRLFTITPPPAA
ncbi:ArsR/SmtB family transcription factor [Actinokineospora soli]|uniref:ArsR/SmtB family transcription factor n=1 Tax=Actinokineospora soli TaxID=1048753 RepID=A0ABW2TNH8_9PSEU